MDERFHLSSKQRSAAKLMLALSASVCVNAAALFLLTSLNAEQEQPEERGLMLPTSRMELSEAERPQIQPMQIERPRREAREQKQEPKTPTLRFSESPTAAAPTLAPALQVSATSAPDFRIPSPSSNALPEFSVRRPQPSESESVDGSSDSATPNTGASGDTPSGAGSGGASKGDATHQPDPPKPLIGVSFSRVGNPADELSLRVRGRFSGTTDVRIYVSAQGEITSVEHIASEVSAGYETHAKNAALAYSKSKIIITSAARRGDVAEASSFILSIEWKK